MNVRITNALIERATEEELFEIGCALTEKLENMRDSARDVYELMESSRYCIIDIKLDRVSERSGMNKHEFSF